MKNSGYLLANVAQNAGLSILKVCGALIGVVFISIIITFMFVAYDFNPFGPKDENIRYRERNEPR